MGVAVGILAVLRVAYPVPFVANAPAQSDQSQQCVWGCRQTDDVDAFGQAISMLAEFRLALAGCGAGDQRHDPTPARPVDFGCSGVFFALSCQRVLHPWRFSMSVALNAIVLLSHELSTDLPVAGVLVGCNGRLSLDSWVSYLVWHIARPIR
jgi:hypothetical protein